MMNAKKWISLLLAASFLLSLCACGNKNVEQTDEGAVCYFGDKTDRSVFNSVKDPLDPEEIYNSIEYTEEMFYGKYLLNSFEKDLPEFCKSAKYEDLEYYYPYGDGELKTEKLSVLPVQIEVGPAALYGNPIRMDRTHQWAVLYFARENQKYEKVLCSFEVKDREIVFTPVDYYKVLQNEEFKTVGLEYKIGEDSLSYTFSFKGPELTLSVGEESVTLRNYDFSSNTKSISIHAYKTTKGAAIENIDSILASKYDNGTSAVYLTDTEDKLVSNGAIRLSENGLMTLYWFEEDENGEKTEHIHQFVYFGMKCMTLVDREYVYYYSESSISREELSLSNGLSFEEVMELDNLTDSELQKIAKKKDDLLADLGKAFSDAGINVSVNKETGEIAMDSSVLFGGDSDVITADGKALLDKFLGVYTSIIFNEKYDGFISKTMVEGHSAPVSGDTYEGALPLSEKRAENVKAYCLSAESGADTAKLASTLEAVGYSNSKPVYDIDGKVDMAASRRVSFRFIVNLNK